MSTSTSYLHILKYTGLFGGVQGLNILIGLVRNKLVALLLGPAGMGLVALFSAVTNFFSQATNLGVSFSAVRHVSEIYESGDASLTQRYVKVVRGWSLLTGLAGMLLMALVGPLLSSGVFAWGDHTLHFVLLSPIVALTAIAGGETALLKGTRQLKALATVQVLSVVTALVVSVPVYYYYGMSGIVPVLVAIAAATTAYTMRFTCRLYPYVLHGSVGVLGEGMEMVRLGVAYVVAGVLGSGAEMAIRSFLNVRADLGVVGLYNAGFMLAITYSGMVFSALETDYFPRLSAVCHDRAAMHQMVNRQVEVSLLLLSPMLAALIVALPLVVPLLYSGKFLPVVAMGQVAVLSMYFRAVALPVEYINLACGASKSYLLCEAAYDVAMVAFVVLGFTWHGLWGTGLALAAVGMFNVLFVLLFMRWRYGYVLSRGVVSYLGVQLALGLAAYAVTLLLRGWAYWLCGVGVALLSLAFSLYVIIYKKTSLWGAIKRKLLRHG